MRHACNYGSRRTFRGEEGSWNSFPRPNTTPHWLAFTSSQSYVWSTMTFSCVTQKCVSLHLGRFAPSLSASTTASLQSPSLASKAWYSESSRLSVKRVQGNRKELRSRTFSVMASATSTATKTVLVTGAGGKTGEKLVMHSWAIVETLQFESHCIKSWVWMSLCFVETLHCSFQNYNSVDYRICALNSDIESGHFTSPLMS